MNISNRVKNITPSVTLAIDAKAKRMQKEGVDIISFGAGEPDFDTPDNIKSKAITAIQKGFTKYTPVGGTIELKEAICAKLKNDNKLNYSTGNIVVSCGAKHSLYNVFQCILNPGDEVIIPKPYWVSYPEMIKIAGGVPVYADTQEQNNFVLTSDELSSKITSNTRAIIINSPSNPSGMIYKLKDLEKIAELAVKHNIMIISDEIYEKLVYDRTEHISIASLGEEIKKHCVVVNGVSKAYSMTGWRIGYIACEENLAKACDNLQSHSTSNPCSISQIASMEALTGSQEKVKEMALNFDRRRKLMINGLNSLPEITCKMPQGAFYAFPNISKLFGKSFTNKKITSSIEVAEFFLDEARVAVVPGSSFGMDSYIRLSYATSDEKIEKGLIRIKETLKKLKE